MTSKDYAKSSRVSQHSPSRHTNVRLPILSISRAQTPNSENDYTRNHTPAETPLTPQAEFKDFLINAQTYRVIGTRELHGTNMETVPVQYPNM